MPIFCNARSKVAEASVPAVAVSLALFLIRQKLMSQNHLCATGSFAKLHGYLSCFHKIGVPGKDHPVRGIDFAIFTLMRTSASVGLVHVDSGTAPRP